MQLYNILALGKRNVVPFYDTDTVGLFRPN